MNHTNRIANRKSHSLSESASLAGAGLDQAPRGAVPEVERWLSLIGGTALALAGLKRTPWNALTLLVAGGYLLYRGLTGHCYIYAWSDLDLGWLADRLPLPPARAQRPAVADITVEDEVLTSSRDSFPTSDPPSWAMGRRSQ